jgi:D-threonate/D-erythronate kinase
MIAVIADDLTGAAEIAGIGLRYGLVVELDTAVVTGSNADLVVICTDSRSLTRKNAEKITAHTVAAILSLKPDLIYKKIDSVLRGYVLDELDIQMELTHIKRAFVLPANPSLGRTIKDGLYYINGAAISETGFATDPEFAITDSSVLKMIRTQGGEERMLKQPDSLPEEGIVIGEAATTEEVISWADKIDRNWVLAGAGDFFIALLEKQYKKVVQPAAEIQLPHLYVCGTAFGKSKEFVRRVKEQTDCVVYMEKDDISEAWLTRVNETIAKHQRCIIAIDGNILSGTTALTLRNSMAKAIKKIIDKTKVIELFIEGGSTAAAILTELEITSLNPVNEIQRGVVRMNAKDMYITMKPGSYELPQSIKELYL